MNFFVYFILFLMSLEQSSFRTTALLEGDIKTLKCPRNKNVLWSKDGHALEATNRVKLMGDRLFFNPVLLEDSGSYQCSFTNGTTRKYQQPISLDVQKLPFFIVRPYSARVRMGARTKFHCAAEGVPTPKILWVEGKGGTMLLIESEHEGDIRVTNKGALVLNNTSGEKFFFSNTAGSVVSPITVENIRKPDKEAPVLKLNKIYDLNCHIFLLETQSQNGSWFLLWRTAGTHCESTTVFPLLIGSSSKKTAKFSPTPANLNRTVVTGLAFYTNYTVLLVTNSSRGVGASNYLNIITEEDIPSAGPLIENVHGEGNLLQLEWKHLTLEETRGKLVQYKIDITSLSKSDHVTITIDGTVNHYTYTQIKPSESYSINIRGCTNKGCGKSSETLFDYQSTQPEKEPIITTVNVLTLFFVSLILGAICSTIYRKKKTATISYASVQYHRVQQHPPALPAPEIPSIIYDNVDDGYTSLTL